MVHEEKDRPVKSVRWPSVCFAPPCSVTHMSASGCLSGEINTKKLELVPIHQGIMFLK